MSFKLRNTIIPSVAKFKGANSKNSKCWPGKVKVGTKMSSTRPGVKVNDCKDPKDI